MKREIPFVIGEAKYMPAIAMRAMRPVTARASEVIVLLGVGRPVAAQ